MTNKKKDKLKFCPLNGDAVFPSKRREDAGYDIYAYFEENWLRLPAHKTTMVGTGIASVFDEKYVAILKERGSTGSRGMGQRAGVIDSGYRGEWLVPITNHNDYDIYIVKEAYLDEFAQQFDPNDCEIYPYGKAICQMVLLPVPDVEVECITREDLESYTSKRMNGKLGSSNK